MRARSERGLLDGHVLAEDPPRDRAEPVGRPGGEDPVAGGVALCAQAVRVEDLAHRERGRRRRVHDAHSRTGDGGDSPDSEPFYTWGTLLPMLAEADLLDLDPFDGLCVGSPAPPVPSAPLPTGNWGLLRAEVEADGLTLTGPDGLVFRAHGSAGRFRSVTPASTALTLSLPASTSTVRIEVPWPVRMATVGGAAVEMSESTAAVVPPGAAGRTLVIERG